MLMVAWRICTSVLEWSSLTTLYHRVCKFITRQKTSSYICLGVGVGISPLTLHSFFFPLAYLSSFHLPSVWRLMGLWWYATTGLHSTQIQLRVLQASSWKPKMSTKCSYIGHSFTSSHKDIEGSRFCLHWCLVIVVFLQDVGTSNREGVQNASRQSSIWSVRK